MRRLNTLRVYGYENVGTARRKPKDPRLAIEAPPIVSRYTGNCACCGAGYTAGRLIYYSTARGDWVIAANHNKDGELVKAKKERKQALVRRKPLARPLSVTCPICVLDKDECAC